MVRKKTKQNKNKTKNKQNKTKQKQPRQFSKPRVSPASAITYLDLKIHQSMWIY